MALLARMPEVYRPTAGNAPPGQTYYQVFTGPNTPFRHNGPTRIPGSFPDGTAKTFLVVEGGAPVPWTKPADMPYDRNDDLPRIGGMFPDGFNAAFADGSTRFLRRPLDDNLVRNLIDPADGNVVNIPD
jgi:prepilin-type processing-associated H-X9-DG protein